MEYADKKIGVIESLNAINIDGELKLSEINMDFYKQVESFAPFGFANQRPVFCIKGANVTEVYVFGIRKEHLKFKISQKGSRNVQAVFWNKSRYANIIKKEDFYDIVFHLDLVDKKDEQIIQLSTIDIKPSY